MDGSTDGYVHRHADGHLGGVGEARWGCKATGPFQMVGEPLDCGSRGLEHVDLPII